jgi:tRNA (mo5U34)-methyltransferase
MKIDYSDFFPYLKATALEHWIDLLPRKMAYNLRPERHGLMPQWEKILDQLPVTEKTRTELEEEVRVDGETIQGLEKLLRVFHPWRKGPYSIHGIHINTEWRSDWKWDRLKDQIEPLAGRYIHSNLCWEQTTI